MATESRPEAASIEAMLIYLDSIVRRLERVTDRLVAHEATHLTPAKESLDEPAPDA